MNDLFKLLKFKDKSNCWLCNSFTEIDSDQPDYFFCLCRGCFNFNIEEYLKEISIQFYDVIDFGDKCETTTIKITLSDNIVYININHESGSDRTMTYYDYNIYYDKIPIKQFKKLNLKDYILKIIDNYKKNLLFI